MQVPFIGFLEAVNKLKNTAYIDDACTWNISKKIMRWSADKCLLYPLGGQSYDSVTSSENYEFEYVTFICFRFCFF